MKKKKLILLTLVTLIFLTGCGTMMEKSRKPITVTSPTPFKAYSDGIKYIGEGKQVTFHASNRGGKGDDFIILKEIGNESNVRTVYLEREFNTWSLWNFLWYGIPYVVDFPTGGTNRLGRTNYQVPQFGELEHQKSKAYY